MRRGAVNIDAKRAGCQAPVRGHNSLGGVMACPFHSKDPATLRKWASRGAKNFTPTQLLTPPTKGEPPINAGVRPKHGHRNIGMSIDVDDLATFARDAHGLSTFENCTIIDKDDLAREGDIRVDPWKGGEIVFKDSDFLAPVELEGNITVENCEIKWGANLRSGVYAKDCLVKGSRPFTLFQATAEDCVFTTNSNIQMSGKSHLVRPRWDTSDYQSKSNIFLFDSVAPKGGTVVLDQGGWCVRSQTGQSGRAAVSGEAVSRTNFVDPSLPETDESKYPVARRRILAGRASDPTLRMDADDIEVWDAYLFLDAGKTQDDESDWDDDAGVDWEMVKVALDMYGRR